MAESLLIVNEEAPPFGEDIASSVIVEPSAADAVGVGVTLPAAAIQFADLTESGSESGDEPNEEEQPQQQRERERDQQHPQQQQQETSSETPAARSSPPPNCAICLSRCRRKCFTDSCMHQFCFKCLCEWSKVSSNCCHSYSFY